MLSDTIFDASQTVLRDLASYMMRPDLYGYDASTVEAVMKALIPLRLVGVDLDCGGDGLVDTLTETARAEAETMLMEQIKDEFERLRLDAEQERRNQD